MKLVDTRAILIDVVYLEIEMGSGVVLRSTVGSV